MTHIGRRHIHDISDNNDIGPPNTDTLDERSETVDNPPIHKPIPTTGKVEETPGKVQGFCFVFFREKPNSHCLARPAPTPRRCKFCEEVLNGKRAQTLHVQSVHRDILKMKKTQAQERERLQKQSGDVSDVAAV